MSKMILLKEKQLNFNEVKDWIYKLKLSRLDDGYQDFIKKTEVRIKEKKK